jgi:5-methylcytosine-specific restriction enzyme subunit McrC
MRVIQKYEHDKLIVGEEYFTRRHLILLSKYHASNGNKYFSLINNGIKFNKYVGVIQVGEISIEVLPKLDNCEDDKGKWQKFLVMMLHATKKLSAQMSNDSLLNMLESSSIFEIYIGIFLNECENILHRGLVKMYKSVEENSHSMKGKLMFTKHIIKNIIHKERFFVRKQVYTVNNTYNQILLKALKIIPQYTKNSKYLSKANTLIFNYPEVDDIKISEKLFSNLNHGRKTYAYKEAISLAALILLNYFPDIKSGEHNIMAIMIDMNELWQEYVKTQLLLHSNSSNNRYKVIFPSNLGFWKYADNVKVLPGSIKPDILVVYQGLFSTKKTFIIDTKWKVIGKSNRPSEDDMKQMFTYSVIYNCGSILLYPKHEGDIEVLSGYFYKNDYGSDTLLHNCNVMKICVFRDNRINLEFGEEILKKLA